VPEKGVASAEEDLEDEGAQAMSEDADSGTSEDDENSELLSENDDDDDDDDESEVAVDFGGSDDEPVAAGAPLGKGRTLAQREQQHASTGRRSESIEAGKPLEDDAQLEDELAEDDESEEDDEDAETDDSNGSTPASPPAPAAPFGTGMQLADAPKPLRCGWMSTQWLHSSPGQEAQNLGRGSLLGTAADAKYVPPAARKAAEVTPVDATRGGNQTVSIEHGLVDRKVRSFLNRVAVANMPRVASELVDSFNVAPGHIVVGSIIASVMRVRPTLSGIGCARRLFSVCSQALLHRTGAKTHCRPVQYAPSHTLGCKRYAVGFKGGLIVSQRKGETVQ
jgi:hypothetical protein